MKKHILSVAVASSLVVSNLMAINYDETLNLIKNKSFKIIHAPYGFDCKDANFSESGIATNDSNTITLQSDGTLQDSTGFNWTIIDNDNNGFILSRTDGGESPASGIMINTNLTENLTDMQTMLPFVRDNTTFNLDGTITNYWNNGDSFTIEDGAIVIPSMSGETYYSNYHMQIAYEVGNYDIMKWETVSEENPYDQWAVLSPSGYTSWYDYLSATNGKINQSDNEGLYDLNTMTQDFGFGASPIIIDQNNTRLFVHSCTPMGEQREETYILQNNHIISQMSDISYFTIKKYDLNTTVDINTTQENNVTTPPEQSTLDIFYPNGWSLSGVGKDENLSTSNIKCQNGTLTSMWKYKNNQWNLYVPSNTDYGYTTFDTLNNRDGFWVNCQ